MPAQSAFFASRYPDKAWEYPTGSNLPAMLGLPWPTPKNTIPGGVNSVAMDENETVTRDNVWITKFDTSKGRVTVGVYGDQYLDGNTVRHRNVRALVHINDKESIDRVGLGKQERPEGVRPGPGTAGREGRLRRGPCAERDIAGALGNVMRWPLAAVAASAILLVGAPYAHADDNAFIADLQAHGVPMPWGPNAAIASGYRTCGELRNGAPVAAVETSAGPTVGGISPWGPAVVSAAQHNLCPDTLK